jgi:hypothetical protein
MVNPIAKAIRSKYGRQGYEHSSIELMAATEIERLDALLQRLIQWDDELQPWQRNPESVVGQIIKDARNVLTR